MKRFRSLFLVPLFSILVLCLGGCDTVVLSPAGDVAARQRDLLVQSTGLMLLIIVPVIAVTILFSWRYRASNTTAEYDPDWDHSTQLELLIWGAPLLIIIALGALTWMGSHLLDPYRPIGRISSEQAVSADNPAEEIEVVALDWKWLFIYPREGIATINEMAAPVNRPISFRITSATVMNSFFVPAMAGQIYAMPGMETRLHAVINQAGEYNGFSANYSGAGFSKMRFAFHGLSDEDFGKWVASVKNGDGNLTRQAYLDLERPSQDEPARHFKSVDSGLFKAILNMCVEAGKMCMSEMSAIDAKGGLGMAGIHNVRPLAYDKYARRGGVFGTDRMAVASICSVAEADAMNRKASPLPTFAADPAPLLGMGLARPSLTPIRFPLPAADASSGQPSKS